MMSRGTPSTTFYHRGRKTSSRFLGSRLMFPGCLWCITKMCVVEMSTRLQTAQQEIQKLRDQLRDSDATVRAYQRMVAGEASDLYTSETCTWSATSSGPGAKDEPAVNSYPPLRFSYSLGAPLESIISVHH
jgi:hypothetical protein